MSTPEVIVYEKSSCSTCRNLAKLLRDNDVEFEKVEYILDPLSADELRALLKKLRVPARELVRTKEAEYAAAGLGPHSTDEQIIAAIAAQPRLMQRPVVVRGKRAVIARPAERVLEILQD